MKAVSMYRPYGWRAAIGLIVPSTNTVIEPEFWRMAPDGVSIHTGRALLLGKATEESYFKMAEAVNRAAEDLATTEVDMVAFGCTSGSFVCPLEQMMEDMQRRANAPAMATAGAVVAALRALNVKKVAVATPYVDFVNESEKVFLNKNGFEVTSLLGLQLGETQEERRGIGRVPPQAVYRMARAVDRPDADAVFLSCTNLATIEVLEMLENELGKPVISSNQATFWASLRMLGIREPVHGYGKLLSSCTEPVDRADFLPR